MAEHEKIKNKSRPWIDQVRYLLILKQLYNIFNFIDS